MDTNLKIWDIKKKGCIHTYKGHTRGISTIRFSPDGRWVVSGGFDNVVKVWDLTAGKLLHDFKFHEGHIRSIDFHPQEFLLATGSADKTVKFWDLETFEMIGSAKREATGVRSITFHPDGRTLFCGLDDSLKVYSWEPVICRDSVDIGWSILGDLCIHDGKLLGGAYYENSVAVWVSNISLIEPYEARILEQHSHLEQKSNSQESPVEKEESHVKSKSKSNLRSMMPDIESKEIKNIYVDCVNTVSSKTVGSLDSSKVVHSSDSMEISTVGAQKQGSAGRLPVKTNVTANNTKFDVPSFVPREGPDRKELLSSRRETNVSAKANDGMSAKPPHTRWLSNARFGMERMSVSVESSVFVSRRSPLGSKKDKLVADDNAKESSEEKRSSIKTVAEKFDKTPVMATPSSQGNLAVKHGRTRSLVERFERREMLNSDEILTSDRSHVTAAEPVEPPFSQNRTPENISREGSSVNDKPVVNDKSTVNDKPPENDKPAVNDKSPENDKPAVNDKSAVNDKPPVNDNSAIENLMQNHNILLSTFRSRLTKLQVVRHFWERNDVKGAINAVRKLLDHSVQADVVGVLIERMEVITLDLFSCVLPVLLGLLESKIERHASVSLEMLLKLVAVFGTVVRSAVSAPPSVGVNLHAEERLKCCKLCFTLLQNIQKILPELVRRGGVVSKCAQELNLVLQQT